jgi:hypothetical protein
VKVFTVTSVAAAEEFLRQSQNELHLLLNGLKRNYVSNIRRFAATAMEKRFNVLRDAIRNLGAQLQPELREDIISMCYC